MSQEAIEILSSDDSKDIISISSREEIISIASSSSSSDSEKKESSATDESDVKPPPEQAASEISSNKSNTSSNANEDQSSSDNDDGNDKTMNTNETKSSLSGKAAVARTDVVSLPSSSDDDDGIISVFNDGTNEDVAIYIGDSEPSVLCISSSDDDSEGNEITFIWTNNSAVRQKMAPRKKAHLRNRKPDKKTVEPVDMGSSNSTPAKSPSNIVGMEIYTSATKLQAKVEKKGDKESSQSPTQSVGIGIDESIQDQDKKPQTRIEKRTSSQSPTHRPSEIDKLAEVTTSLKRTTASTDNISKKKRRTSPTTKSSSQSMENWNAIQSSLDKVQKNQTKMKKDMLRKALKAKNEMLSKVMLNTDAKRVPTLLTFVKEKPLEAEYLKDVDYPIPRDTSTTIFVQRNFAESDGTEDHNAKEKYDDFIASDEMAVYEEEERDKEISLVLKNSTHIEEKVLHENLATLLKVEQSHIKYLSEKLNQKLEVVMPDNPYEREMSTFRDLFCQRCMVYDCFVHGSKRGHYNPQLQAEIALLKEESGYWADGESLTCKVIGEAKSSFPRKRQDKKELELSEAQQVLGQRLSHIFGGDLNHVASTLGVPFDSIDKRIKSEYLDYQFINPKKVDKRKFTSKGKNSITLSRARNKVKNIPFPFPCYHTEPCSEKSCTCVENGHWCTTSCIRNVLSDNFFSGCRCTGKCSLKSCPCLASNRECHPDRCTSCGTCSDPPGMPVTRQKCHNDNISMRRHKHLLIAKSGIENAGMGCFTKYPIKKNEYIHEYVGEIVSPEEADNRGWGYNTEKSYLFELCNDFDIDGCYIGNKTRFINHGTKEANVSVRTLYVNGEQKIAFFAKRNIPAQTELLYNYGNRFFIYNHHDDKGRIEARKKASG